MVVGANDMGRDRPERVLEKLECLVERIWTSNPDAAILLSSVLPRAQSDGKYIPFYSWPMLNRISRCSDIFNDMMRRFVEDTPNLYMVDHHAFIVDDRVQRHLLSRDGLHLSPDGIRTMLQDILDSVDTLRLSYIDSDAVYDSPVKPLPEPPLPPALVPEDWPLLPAPATSLVTYPAAASAK